MIYTKEVENMCPVNKGTYHGPAPIPQEGKWVQVKEVSDISGLTVKNTRLKSETTQNKVGEIRK